MQALTDFLLPLFLALGSLWFAVDLVKKLRAPAPRPEPSPAPLPAVSSPASAPAEPFPSLPHSPTPSFPAHAPSPHHSLTPSLPDSAHLAVIAATIHHLFRGRARLVGIAPAGAHPATAVDWAREGRRDIFSSHRLR